MEPTETGTGKAAPAAPSPAPALKPGRGRRRAEDVRRAALAATSALLFDAGVKGVTFEKVAARAGVSKMTLYRWWSTPGRLVFEAYFSALEEALAFPDTGDVRADLTAQLHSFVGLFQRGGATIAQIIGAAQSDPDLIEALSDQYVRPRRQLAVDRLAAARAAGQIRADADLDAIVDQLWGACYHRLLLPVLPQHPVDTAFADALIANLFRGVAT
ncbi:TetR-like C-terminal domain-containing protein [Actinospica sp.]|uniref:TetR-like C-terminal domain-containing protein n=1 Tax=Actinospica sp. TaxID=1872142 RepID=UPI002B8130F3|nr:TetR-like C-terminal domain-containing protein [Actinospica sp.]HWG26283.1 TetR-like C-terminal domain-containing protein [Actinospica sp.]